MSCFTAVALRTYSLHDLSFADAALFSQCNMIPKAVGFCILADTFLRTVALFTWQPCCVTNNIYVCVYIYLKLNLFLFF